ncbi:MAG: anti-sigma factor antagonist [Solirubrobacteraceae bacterium]
MAARPAERQMAGTRGGGADWLEVLDLPTDKVAGVAVRGEVELATAPVLTAALEEGIRRSSGPFVVDLAAVDFLDSSGIHCLVRARALLGRDDRALALICPPNHVRRVLELAGIDELVPVYGSREELARALTPPPDAGASD